MSTFHRVMSPCCVEWTEAQTALLLSSPHLTDDEMASAVSALGPSRTVRAVGAQRAVLGIPFRSPIAPEVRLSYLDHRAGWPVMHGTQEQRDHKYVAMLAIALAQQAAA